MPLPKKITFVSFDCYGTLIDWETGIFEAFKKEAARDDGFLFCPEGGAVLAAYRKALAEGLVTGGERALLFNCANGSKYPLPDRSRRLKLEGAEPTAL